MRINIALFDKDSLYIEKLLKGFQSRYAKQAIVRSFSDETVFVKELQVQYFDIAVISQQHLHLRDSIPERVALAVFVNDNSIEEIEGVSAVGKYQQIDSIYKRIVGIYADNSPGIKVKKGIAGSKTVLFTSVQGGGGTSSLAAAFALNQAKKGKEVFYLNLETFGSPNAFFHGEGSGSFSDIIYALKLKNVNFALKLQSTIQRDESGVEFITGCRNAFDMLELKDSEIGELLEGLSMAKQYDEFVIDYSGAMTPRQQYLMKQHADSIIYVNDGSEIGNEKFSKFCEVVRVMEKRDDIQLLRKIGLVYNRYSSQTSRQLEAVPVVLFGGIHRIEGISGRRLVEELARQDAVSAIS